MKRKELFEPPVVAVFELGMESPVLAGSMTPGAETEGQEVKEFDYSGNDWDD